MAWLALGVSAGDVLGVPLAPRVVAVPVEFCTRALTGGVCVLAACPRAFNALAEEAWGAFEAWAFDACVAVAACAAVIR